MPLIIDDNATDLFVLSQLLTREGVAVTEVRPAG